MVGYIPHTHTHTLLLTHTRTHTQTQTHQVVTHQGTIKDRGVGAEQSSIEHVSRRIPSIFAHRTSCRGTLQGCECLEGYPFKVSRAVAGLPCQGPKTPKPLEGYPIKRPDALEGYPPMPQSHWRGTPPKLANSGWVLIHLVAWNTSSICKGANVGVTISSRRQ